MRIALIADTTIAPLRRPLSAALSQLGINPHFLVLEGQEGDFSANAGCLDDFSPELVILSVHSRTLAPALYKADTLMGPVEERREICEEAANEMLERIRVIRTAATGTILVNDFAAPLQSPLGIQDTAVELGLHSCIRTINERLEADIRSLPGVRLVPVSAVAAKVGDRGFDNRLWSLVGQEESTEMLQGLAETYVRHVRALLGQTRKVLVLEADGLFWDGHAGEDKVYLNPEGRGRAQLQFQQICLDLYHRGLQLALVSRNDREDVLSVLRNHPHMVLGTQHFSAIEIGWNDKATSCQQVANQLHVGLDSIVYLDPSATERHWVKTVLPEIEVVELPGEASMRGSALQQLASLECDQLFATRPAPLATSTDRAGTSRSSPWVAGVADYLEHLQTQITIGAADRVGLPTLVEIVQRTEAVELVGRPVDQDYARLWTRSGLHQGYWVRLQDRFGDRGVVGLVVVEAGEEAWCIDSFQVSSRVLERGVDTELVLALGTLAENQGVRRLEVSTDKTQQSRAFEALGFLPSLRPGVTCQLDLVKGWRKQLWRPSYVDGTCILGDEEEKVAA